MLTSSDKAIILPILKSIGAYVYLVDVLEDGTFHYFAINWSEDDDIGLTCPGTIVGKRPEEVFEIERAGKLIQCYKRCLELQSTIEFEVSFESKSGRQWVNHFIAPIFDLRGCIVRIMGTIVNITERKKAEEELIKHRDHLNELVEERTYALQKINEELEREIAERKKMEKQIMASLKEKEMLLREIRHRGMNNIQIVFGLMDIQSDYIKDKQCLEIFKCFRNQITSMSLAHKTLYESEELPYINFHEYINKLANRLYQSYGVITDRVALVINIDDVTLGVNTALYCGLTINELLSNSLKYAFPDSRNGEIKIILRSSDKNEYELIFSDNGRGIPEELDIKETDTIGLKMVGLFVEDMLRGKIDLNRGRGTEFVIKFKV
jgi:PAS domain S-box-containing protein